MINKRKQFVTNESGLTLSIVLGVFALCSMLLMPALHYAATSLLYVRTEENKTQAILAADAGFEDVIWSIQNSKCIRAALPQNINNMNVTMKTVDHGVYVLYRGDMVPVTEHSSYVLMASGNMTWVASQNAYQFTISVTKTGGCNRTGQASGRRSIITIELFLQTKFRRAFSRQSFFIRARQFAVRRCQYG